VSVDVLREQSRRTTKRSCESMVLAARRRLEFEENRRRSASATRAVVEDDADATVLDYGCGFGALAAYSRTRGHRGGYAA
jgi:cyclopropane fatty-acyl-phospholipid synthase-like methyltransferase